TIPVPAAPPALSPGGGTFTSSVSVTLTDSTPGATIYYTTDGSTPTTSSAAYSGPITVTTTQTIKAIAVASGYTTSAVASATYTIQVPAATPALSPGSGTYTSSVAPPRLRDAHGQHPRRDDLLHDRREHAHDVVDGVHGSDHRDDDTDDQGDRGGVGVHDQRGGQRHVHDPGARGHAGAESGQRHLHLLGRGDAHGQHAGRDDLLHD